MKEEIYTDIEVLHVSWGTALEHGCPVGTSRHRNMFDTLLKQNPRTEYLKIRLNPDLNQASLANSNK